MMVKPYIMVGSPILIIYDGYIMYDGYIRHQMLQILWQDFVFSSGLKAKTCLYMMFVIMLCNCRDFLSITNMICLNSVKL